MLLQEEPPTTGLAPLIRCQRRSAPPSESNHAALDEGCCSDRDAGIKTATQNTPDSSAYSESVKVRRQRKTASHPCQTRCGSFCPNWGWMAARDVLHTQAAKHGNMTAVHHLHPNRHGEQAVRRKVQSLQISVQISEAHLNTCCEYESALCRCDQHMRNKGPDPQPSFCAKMHIKVELKLI